MSRNPDTVGNTLNSMINSAYGSTTNTLNALVENKVLLFILVVAVIGIVYWLYKKNNP